MATPAWLMLASSFLCTAFGGGMQAISVLAWLQPLALLRFFSLADISQGPWSRQLAIISGAVAVQAIGSTIAFAGMFNDPDFTPAGVLTVSCVAAALWAAFVWPFIADSVFRDTYRMAWAAQPFVFPVLWTAMWHILGAVSPIGTIGSPAYSQLALRPLVLSAGLFGLDGIVFAVSWAAAVAHEALVYSPPDERASYSPCRQEPKDGDLEGGQKPPRGAAAAAAAVGFRPVAPNGEGKGLAEDEVPPGRHALAGPGGGGAHAMACGAFVGLLLLYGGLREVVFSPSFYQRGIAATIRPTVAVSCILSQYDADFGRSGGEPPEIAAAPGGAESLLWARTRERVAAGDSIVLWSETAVYVEGDEGEARLLRRAREAVRHRPARPQWAPPGSIRAEGPYLGVTYLKLLEGAAAGEPGSYVNAFALVLPDGSVALSLNKSHPVPFVEDSLQAGEAVLRSVPTPLGRMAAAICFDLEFASFLQQSGRQGVDIMLQPSWTWGPIGGLETESDAVRAVENGFTLFRCSSNGMSGIVSPLYRFESWREGLSSGVHVSELALTPHLWTFYPHGGFVFGYIVVIAALIFAFTAFLPLWRVRRATSLM